MMPGLDLANLSSNWKKLQKNLTKSNVPDKETHGVKRKRAVQTTKPSTSLNGLKKRPGHETSNRIHPLKKRKMGSSTSRPDDEPLPKVLSRQSSRTSLHPPPTTLPPPPPPVASTTDLINSGLHPTNKPGKYLSLDCEMVGTGPPPHSDNVLARVSIVNYHGQQIYDSYVLPPTPTIRITDYRTFVSGIRPEHLHPDTARPFTQVCATVSKLLDHKILVGHALKNDLAVLLLDRKSVV